jgi:hypothetical protein
MILTKICSVVLMRSNAQPMYRGPVHEQNFPVAYIYNEQHHDICTVFCSVQFIQFRQIHYKSNRPIGYRISHSTVYIQILMHKVSIQEVTIITRAGNKMTLMCGYLIDWFNWYDWLIHFQNCIWYGPRHKNRHNHSILYIVHDKRMEHSFLRRQFLTTPRQRYWNELSH